jgi:putative transposase
MPPRIVSPPAARNSVTAATYRKHHFFNDATRLDVLQRGLLKIAAEFQWHLEAWAIFSNHYHFVAHSPDSGAKSLPSMLGKLHGKTSAWLNRIDRQPGRKVWHNYWDTLLNLEGSYLARLNYVHQNPVHHGLVPVPNQYPWCSAPWFEDVATPAQIATIYRVKIHRVRVLDAFSVLHVAL